MENKVVKNAGWIIGCKIVQSILSLVIGALTARYLGPSNYGVINYAASIVAFMTPVMQLGINLILVNELVNNPQEEGKILGTSLTLNFISGLISCGVIFVFVSIMKSEEPIVQLVCVLYSLVLLAQAMEMVSYWFQAKLLSKYVSVVSIVAYVVISAYKLYLLITEKSIAWFAVSQAIDYLLIALILMVVYRKLGGAKYEFSITVARRLWGRGKYYIISSMMVTSFVQIDKVFIEMYLDSAQVGLYSAAVVCSGIANFVFTAIIDSARPSIFAAKKGNQDDYEQKVKLLFSIVVYLGIAQGIVLMIAAPWVISILYGSDYAASVDALRVLGWVTVFSTIGSVRNVWILAEEKQKHLWIVNLLGACFNIVGNIVLIPIMGVVGTAVVSLTTQVFTNVVTGIIVKPLSHYNFLLLSSLNPKELVRTVKQLLSAVYSKARRE